MISPFYPLKYHICLIAVILRLPGSTDKLIESVIAANPHTVIVNQSGAPVAMPWLDKLEHGALLQVGRLVSHIRICNSAYHLPGVLWWQRDRERDC